MKDNSGLIKSLRDVRAVAVGEVDDSGRLLDANEGFLRLLPAGVNPVSRTAVGFCFLSPSYERLIELAASGKESVYRGLLTLGEQIGKVRSLSGTVSRTKRGLFFLLEHDIEEMELVVEKSLESASALAMAHRDLVSVNHRLTLAEAERKRNEQRIRQSEQNLRRVLDHLPLQTSLMSKEGELVWVNQATLDFLGESREAAVGRHIWDRPNEFEPQPEFKAELEVMCRTGGSGNALPDRSGNQSL